MRCATCDHTWRTGEAVYGLCPRCLMRAGLESAQAPARADAATPGTPAALERALVRYELRERLGRGGAGVVYRARCRETDEVLAVKVLVAHDVEDPAFLERFEREARALSRLRHPGIVGVRGAGVVDGHAYIALEYVEGTTLRQLLRSGPLAVPRTLAIVTQLCDALEYAHARGVVHRDLKPENVMLAADGAVKLLDFGLARLAGREATGLALTRTQDSMGTPVYMAPEQFESPQAVDARVDVFALGVLFYELLTGELPLGRFDPPSQVADVDARFDPVVMRALSKRPERRHAGVAELQEHLDASLRRTRPVITGSFRLKRLRLTQRSAHSSISIARVALLAVPTTFLYLATETWAPTLLASQLLLSVGVLGWGEGVLRGLNRQRPRGRWLALVALLAALAAQLVLASLLAERGPRALRAPLVLPAAALLHAGYLAWVAWRRWDAFVPPRAPSSRSTAARSRSSRKRLRHSPPP